MNDSLTAQSALGVPAPFETILVDGVQLAYDDTGSSNVPVVCLHAVGHGGGDFGFLRERIRRGHRVIRLDWPGQGRSGPDREPASARRYATLLGLFLDSIGVERAILLGNSIGGAAAIEFTASHPDRVRGLVLANPGGLGPVNLASRAVCRAMARFFRSGARGARWFGRAFRIYYGTVLRQPEASARRDQIVSAAYEVAPVLAEAWAGFARRDSDLRGLVAGIHCPVWFAWARQDRIIAYARNRRAIESFPNAMVQLFRGGHCAFLEDREAFVEGFLAFSEGVRRDTPDATAMSA
jgi:4,5:9,10-diseco-3-hydroxy-5,9,17-trioxoandrosta-1(10),2-diene-4-oate hydrolase